jgi:hypothetical protein
MFDIDGILRRSNLLYFFMLLIVGALEILLRVSLEFARGSSGSEVFGFGDYDHADD